jgi:rhodanese-related sulfurtransferase
MHMSDQGPDESGSATVRGILVIVALGIALGVIFNSLQLASGPRHGLAWIKHEVKLASLESVAGTAEAAAATGEIASAAQDSGSTMRADSAAGDTTPAAAGTHKAGKTAKGTKPGAHGAKASPAGAATPKAQGATTAGATASKPAEGTQAVKAPPSDLPNVPDTKEPMEAQYATIKKFWDAGAAFFVDARTAEEYAEGHIPGAVSLPFDDVFKDPDKAKHLDTHGRSVVITYCGGGDCDLSRNLAFSLIDAGQKKVLVFTGGMPGWKDAGNPVATGATPGTAP